MLVAVFDIESVGLHGTGFAAGAVVVDTLNGATLDEFYAACTPEKELREAPIETFQWVSSHVLPHLQETHDTAEDVRDAFWAFWRIWQGHGAKLLADCAWPVEANFLSACIADSPKEREWQGPYPLLDLAPILLAQGHDPLATLSRLPSELPAHDPLADARQSARLFLEALKRSQNPSEQAITVESIRAMKQQMVAKGLNASRHQNVATYFDLTDAQHDQVAALWDEANSL